MLSENHYIFDKLVKVNEEILVMLYNLLSQNTN